MYVLSTRYLCQPHAAADEEKDVKVAEKASAAIEISIRPCATFYTAAPGNAGRAIMYVRM